MASQSGLSTIPTPPATTVQTKSHIEDNRRSEGWSDGEAEYWSVGVLEFAGHDNADTPIRRHVFPVPYAFLGR
jgi:hypothetical protein